MWLQWAKAINSAFLLTRGRFNRINGRAGQLVLGCVDLWCEGSLEKVAGLEQGRVRGEESHSLVFSI